MRNSGIRLMIACLLFSAMPARAQITVTRDVIGSGGGKTNSGGYQLLHTVGQTVTGELSGVDNTNEIGFWYLPWFFITGVDGEKDPFPRAYRLEQNYPNPFNPATTIRFALPKRSHVNLKVYDVLGREVATLVDREMGPGLHSVSLYAGHLSSGVYFLRIKAGSFIESKKMILVR